MYARLSIAYLVGGLEALLLARLLFRMLAARPDHPLVQAIMWITTPLIAPLSLLDSGQPRFGSSLEFSALLLIVLLPLLGIILGYLFRDPPPDDTLSGVIHE